MSNLTADHNLFIKKVFFKSLKILTINFDFNYTIFIIEIGSK